MKNINFINPIPLQLRKDLRIWIWLTLIFSSITVIGILTTTVIKLRIYNATHTEKKNLENLLTSFTTTMATLRKQEQEKELLTKTLRKLERYTGSGLGPIDVLSLLNKIAGPTAIQSITVSKRIIDITLLCTSAKQAQTLFSQLTAQPLFRALKLVSLQTHQQQLHAHFKGELAFAHPANTTNQAAPSQQRT